MSATLSSGCDNSHRSFAVSAQVRRGRRPQPYPLTVVGGQQQPVTCRGDQQPSLCSCLQLHRYAHGPPRRRVARSPEPVRRAVAPSDQGRRSEEHTSELQSHHDLVCRLLLEKKKSTELPIGSDKKQNNRSPHL